MQSNETRQYRIGGLVWELAGPAYQESQEMERFRTEGESVDLRVQVDVVEEPTLPELPRRHREVFTDYFGDGTIEGRVVYLEGKGTVLLSEQDPGTGVRRVECARSGLPYYGYHLALRILDIPYQMPKYGGVFLHASYIEVNGQAILFTAPKQTGKSTQAALWEKHRGAKVINGDRALLRKLDGVWCACGSPYCGTSGICLDRTLPLRAVVVLGQAKENRVQRASVREAMAAFLDGCSFRTWDRTQVEQVITLIEQMITQVPVIRLDCVPDESAVCALEEFLWKLEMT